MILQQKRPGLSHILTECDYYLQCTQFEDYSWDPASLFSTFCSPHPKTHLVPTAFSTSSSDVCKRHRMPDWYRQGKEHQILKHRVRTFLKYKSAIKQKYWKKYRSVVSWLWKKTLCTEFLSQALVSPL